MSEQLDICFVGDRFHAEGFRLAGLKNSLEFTDDNRQQVLEKLRQVSGLVLMTRKASEELSSDIEQYPLDALVLTLPDETEGGDYLSHLIAGTLRVELQSYTK